MGNAINQKDNFKKASQKKKLSDTYINDNTSGNIIKNS
jgi:hypothetical protein